MNKEEEKKSWGPGPWQDEPDRVEFNELGFPCLMKRNMDIGIWCGYVAVHPGHPWHSKYYNEIRADVHGGLTYSAACRGGEVNGICHKPKPGESEDVWWLGFDCGHGFDVVPSLGDRFYQNLSRNCTYRDVAYVRRQVVSLAHQARDAQLKEQAS